MRTIQQKYKRKPKTLGFFKVAVISLDKKKKQLLKFLISIYKALITWKCKPLKQESIFSGFSFLVPLCSFLPLEQKTTLAFHEGRSLRNPSPKSVNSKWRGWGVEREVRQLLQKTWCSLTTRMPWSNYVTHLDIGFSLYKMGIIIHRWAVMWTEWDNKCQTSRIWSGVK